MTSISAKGMDQTKLNEAIRAASGDVTITDCMGHRFIGAGASGRKINIYGTPGNALGAYLDGADIIVHGNAQDAVGDTMNDGNIIIHGNAGDALGYAMRGGVILVKGNSGYRTGIHMKQYKEKFPIIVVGGCGGSFLGEYMAGGLLIVLGMDCDGPIVGNFTGTGIHGGEIWLRCGECPSGLPGQVSANKPRKKDFDKIIPYVRQYAEAFGADMDKIMSSSYWRLTPNASNPYHQIYTTN